MKDCQKYGDDCSKCNAKEFCDALKTLLDIISEKPKIPSDDKIKKQTMEYVHNVGLMAFDESILKEIYSNLEFETLQGLVLASMQIVSDLYLSWEDKCAQIDSLKVQLEAQEALHGETV